MGRAGACGDLAMVLCSNTKYTVGAIVRDRVFRDQRGVVITDQPIYIIREVGLQAWIDDTAEGGDPPSAQEILQAQRYKYYYEVHTD